jgi:hypothetical protein
LITNASEKEAAAYMANRRSYGINALWINLLCIFTNFGCNREAKTFDGIIGNDFQSWQDSTDTALVQAVARGIRNEDKIHMHTAELNYRYKRLSRRSRIGAAH